MRSAGTMLLVIWPLGGGKIITENFEIIDGHHVYPNRKDQEIADAAAHEASKKADRIIYDTFTGKYK